MGNIEKFNLIANKYDTPERNELAKLTANIIREYITNGREKDAIDYGCGTGLVGMQLLDDFRSVLFVDAADNMIEQVNEKIIQSQAKNAKACCFDFLTNFPADLHTDYIIMVHTLIHIKEVESILSHLYGILNEGGHLLIVDFDENDKIISDEVHNGFNQEKLSNVLEKIGFTNVQAKLFHHGKKLFMNQDASIFILDAKK